MLSGLSLMICMTILLLASLLTFVSQDQTIIMITMMIKNENNNLTLQTTVPAMSYVAVVAVITFVVGFATGAF